MKCCRSYLVGRRGMGVLAVGFFAACSVALQAGKPGSQVNDGSVKVIPGMPEGVAITIAPATVAISVDTALANEEALYPGSTGVALAAGTCSRDVDCDDCSTCTTDTCVFVGGAFTGTCSNVDRGLCDACGDDIFCNGSEQCDTSGGCRSPALRPCEDDPTTICDESLTSGLENFCVEPCGTGGVAVTDDLIACNGTEVCQLVECVGGTNAGAPCADDTPCTGGFCGGVVAHVDPPCGALVNCTEGDPVVCSIFGRCCEAGLACTRTKKIDCAGSWLQVGDSASTEEIDDNPDGCTVVVGPGAVGAIAGQDLKCPVYSAGVAPSGPFPEFLGNVGHAACGGNLTGMGDDYAIIDSGSGGANEGKFLRLNTFHWVGGFQRVGIQNTASRYLVVFYDASGNRIVDTITNGSSSGTAARRTVVFGEQPIIPANGFVVIEPATRFAPFSRIFWAMTQGTDVGTNDLATLWIDGAEAAAVGTGQLAFELVGDIIDNPEGACCDSDTGACSLTLPWLCNGFFQGPGVACQVCQNDVFAACGTDLDCPACAGDPSIACDPNAECPTDGICNGGICDNDGSVCDVNVDCPSGDTCSATSTCVPVPPACALTACCVTDGNAGIQFCVGGTNADDVCNVAGTCSGGACNTVTLICDGGADAGKACCDGGTCTGAATGVGDCVTVRGASCLESGGACSSDTICFDVSGSATDTCEPPCPTGSVANGFGTSCFPQICAQPGDGFDTCVEASDPLNLRIITVPPIGAEPVVETFSGNNLAATFNDHQNDVVPPENATCSSAIFNSSGTADRGWWHAFSINDCAVVRVDYCGTFERAGDIREPQWASIWAACDPCGATVPPVIVGAQGGRDSLGDDEASGDRGLPFCTGGDDLWETYGPLNAGVYWVPIYSAPNGYFGPYQMHVAVSACPVAACCLPSSFCVDPGTQFLLKDGAGNPFPCDTVSCVDQVGAETGSCEACALAQQPDCDTIGGFWNALANLPAGSPSFVADCGFGGAGACDIGSCCGADGCRDNFPGDAASCATDPSTCCDLNDPTNTCMTRTLCDVEAGGPGLGSFVGGAQCDFPSPPCPACGLLGTNNCQMPPLVSSAFAGPGSAATSDLTVPPNGTVAADDFVPNGSTLSSLCVWGFYHDTRVNAVPRQGCIGAVTDEFRVRVYADNGNLPGVLVGESLVTGENIKRSREPGLLWENSYGPGSLNDSDALAQGYTLFLDNPITGMISGQKHWLEVANNTTGSTPAAKTCWWNWLQSYREDSEDGPEFDGYSASGANSGGTLDEVDYLGAPSRYINGSGRFFDLAFCLGTNDGTGDVGLDFVGLTEKAACWTCPGDTPSVCTVETMSVCARNGGIQGIWSKNDPDCSGTFADVEGSVAGSCSGAPFPARGAASFVMAGPNCGDGVLDTAEGEQCDPAPAGSLPTATCDITCQLTCPAPPIIFGVCDGGVNDGNCVGNVCDGGAVNVGAACATDDDCVGVVCTANADCPANAFSICHNGALAGEVCTTVDNCGGAGGNPPRECKVEAASCFFEGVPARIILAGLEELNSNCSGADAGANLRVEGNAQINVGNDSWFFYETTCTGRMSVSACPSQPGCNKAGCVNTDSVLALYHNIDELPTDDFLCPGANDNFQSDLGSDEGCNGYGDQGPGVLSRLVFPGEKWTIRLTNWGTSSASAGAGSQIIDVDCIESACPIAAPPSIHQLPDGGGTPRDNNKGRMLPVVVDDVGRVAAIQVEFVDLPPPYDQWNGTKMFARAPIPVCETGSIGGPGTPCSINTYQTSRLECTGLPFTTDWNALGVVNIWHEGIVPGGVYNVRIMDESCNAAVAGSFSEPTVFNTAKYGDTVGVGGFQIPVDGSVGVSDALAGIATFSTAPGKPSKSRTELAQGCISHTANINDVLASLAGFSGLPYSEMPSTLDACDSLCSEP